MFRDGIAYEPVLSSITGRLRARADSYQAPSNQPVAEDLEQPGVTHLACCGFVVVRHSDIDQYVTFDIERAVTGGRVVVTRLTDRADTATQRRGASRGISTDCTGSKPAIFSVGDRWKRAGT